MAVVKMDIDVLNGLPEAEFQRELQRCCGTANWITQMALQRPFSDEKSVFEAASRIWWQLSPSDWREAFTHHPKIGDIDSLRARFGNTREWAQGEQAGVASATDDIITALAEGNEAYEKKFGYIFIVCATGKTAAEMLALLQARLSNDAPTELPLAAAEQDKITRIRLEKLFS